MEIVSFVKRDDNLNERTQRRKSYLLPSSLSKLPIEEIIDQECMGQDCIDFKINVTERLLKAMIIQNTSE